MYLYYYIILFICVNNERILIFCLYLNVCDCNKKICVFDYYVLFVFFKCDLYYFLVEVYFICYVF